MTSLDAAGIGRLLYALDAELPSPECEGIWPLHGPFMLGVLALS